MKKIAPVFIIFALSISMAYAIPHSHQVYFYYYGNNNNKLIFDLNALGSGGLQQYDDLSSVSENMLSYAISKSQTSSNDSITFSSIFLGNDLQQHKRLSNINDNMFSHKISQVQPFSDDSITLFKCADYYTCPAYKRKSTKTLATILDWELNPNFTLNVSTLYHIAGPIITNIKTQDNIGNLTYHSEYTYTIDFLLFFGFSAKF